jgi:two-component system chemotaxis response regulator CheY
MTRAVRRRPAHPYRALTFGQSEEISQGVDRRAGHGDCIEGAPDLEEGISMQILVVDDSKAMRSIVMRAVRQAGYDSVAFVEAVNGAEALKLIRATPPDLVLADWNMPEMSGIELLKTLRAEGNLIKVGFVTSESDPAMRDMAFQSGALFMITKPFTPDSLKAVLGPVMT